MRKIGLDLGSKTCGISISDDSNMIANGLKNFSYQRGNLMEVIGELKKIIKEYENNVDMFVLGLSTNLKDNSISTSGERSLKFKTLLEQNFKNIDVVLWNENFSTIKANELMFNADLKASQRKKRIDMVAATIILQEYLDVKHNK